MLVCSLGQCFVKTLLKSRCLSYRVPFVVCLNDSFPGCSRVSLFSWYDASSLVILSIASGSVENPLSECPRYGCPHGVLFVIRTCEVIASIGVTLALVAFVFALSLFAHFDSQIVRRGASLISSFSLWSRLGYFTIGRYRE